jgi:NitT/TauT family transport system ATP-binding protein
VSTQTLHVGRVAETPGPTQARASAVIINRVSKQFVEKTDVAPVIDDLSLTVYEGEFVCLLGASGCGKSTLLSLVAGLERPTAGTIAVPGGRTALMFQESALFPWLTAGKNIELALRLAKVPRQEWSSEIDRLLELVHLSGQRNKRVHELSGGMRQRVALARALAQRARVLLMDEPFAALDAITRDVLHDELHRIWRDEGLTVIFVTHNVREAVRLGQRVLLMSSRPGRFVRSWNVDVHGPRRIESADVARLATEITEDLRKEIRRHGK